ncbi:MAG: helix-hairpin-helix domain-containing protein [Aeromicrobium sp.]
MIVERPTQTRAEIARARMADLLASFDASAAGSAKGESRSHAAEVSWRVPPTHLRVLVAVAVAAGVLLTWWLLSARPRTDEPQAVQLSAHREHDDEDHADSGPSAGTLVLDVEGKVKRPGIITLPRGSRVHEAIAKAGGLVEGADTTGVNLARVVADGEQIIVGSQVAGAPDGASPAAAAAPGGRVSLSSATAEQLDQLPGIGPVTADAIIAHRTAHGGFQRVEDLLDVKGIGEKTLADIRDQVTP